MALFYTCIVFYVIRDIHGSQKITSWLGNVTVVREYRSRIEQTTLLVFSRTNPVKKIKFNGFQALLGGALRQLILWFSLCLVYFLGLGMSMLTHPSSQVFFKCCGGCVLWTVLSLVDLIRIKLEPVVHDPPSIKMT